MNKLHWNTLDRDASSKGTLASELVRHPCDPVVATLPRQVREKLV